MVSGKWDKSCTVQKTLTCDLVQRTISWPYKIPRDWVSKDAAFNIQTWSNVNDGHTSKDIFTSKKRQDNKKLLSMYAKPLWRRSTLLLPLKILKAVFVPVLHKASQEVIKIGYLLGGVWTPVNYFFSCLFVDIFITIKISQIKHSGHQVTISPTFAMFYIFYINLRLMPLL